MTSNKTTNLPETIPLTGKSRWSQLKPFIPVSKEKFRQLSVAGLAPKRCKLGERITMYDNAEVHRWLADPAGYRAEQSS
ncbi:MULTISPECIES: helix-turn-helix transcriptional regulator [Nitrosomonas]|uniref:Transcriptional regulator n=2 Tax=Nitrosomonas eutropha TaxID=916 RepID=A0ABX5M6F3_9PROT|nr:MULTISPECIES: hypothetical protein [Nitrosomonas]ABI59379.1 conserved hypothetical protein [Nitrosomonas eutropha C91]MXS81462.1 transcriptional regulator [Nitrosomonas sp. GH22]PXV72606.1 hypothetical protein C8R14_1671 [Nitrosomonas eutropha]SCX29791.1 hypothetical protein SAMN05216379_1633 [Nitrosomonas eutropha]SDX17051.1 hypothetical protein SAMN05216317_1513 [Nitrosomonas eutropha]